MNETDFQNGFILGMSAGGSSIAEVDLPFTEDDKGNVIFEKDIYYKKTKKISDLETNINKNTKGLSTHIADTKVHIEQGEGKNSEIFNDTTNLASGDYSHAQGQGTIATGDVQHVEGKFNIEDTENQYSHIIGNGEDADNRSNAHTVDWNGNAWYAGTATVKDLLIEKEVDGENVTESVSDKFIEIDQKFIDAENNIIQPDFEQGDPTAKDYIKNKPRIKQNYVILSDTDNGYNYAIQITNGNLITSPMPVGTKVTTLPTKVTYYRGDFLDTAGMVVSVYGEDGSVGTTNKYTSFYFDNPFNKTGRVAVTMVSDLFGKQYNASFVVDVVEFDPEIVLIDFDYTTNDDGTYTITGWKETLNGEPSTELIVPNNSLIRV